MSMNLLQGEKVYTCEQNAAKARLVEFGVNKFTADRLNQLYYALDHWASSYVCLAEDVKLGIKKDIKKLVRIKKPASNKTENKSVKAKSTKKVVEKNTAIDLNNYNVDQSLKIIILKLFPIKPWCCDEFYQNSPRKLEMALKKRYIQYNPPGYLSFLIVDCDYAGAKDAWKVENLPTPTWTTTNPINGHAHLCWALTSPVWGGGKNKSPSRLFKAVLEAYRKALRGDVGFACLLTKNPLNTGWHLESECDFTTYDLAELMSCVKLEKVTKNKIPTIRQDIGRNCTLFDKLRFFAYSHARNFDCPDSFYDALEAEAEKINYTFSEPLPMSEVRSVSRSISRFSYVACVEHDERFLQRQAVRGRKGGVAKGLNNMEKRCYAIELNSRGVSKQKIANELKVSRDCVNRWVLPN